MTTALQLFEQIRALQEGRPISGPPAAGRQTFLRAEDVPPATPDTVIDEELPYVALSRARTHLVIAGTDKVLMRMRGLAAASVDR